MLVGKISWISPVWHHCTDQLYHSVLSYRHYKCSNRCLKVYTNFVIFCMVCCKVAIRRNTSYSCMQWCGLVLRAGASGSRPRTESSPSSLPRSLPCFIRERRGLSCRSTGIVSFTQVTTGAGFPAPCNQSFHHLTSDD